MADPFEYAPAPESRSGVPFASSYGLFIDGAFRDPVDGAGFKTVNPATEEVLAEVSAAGAADVDLAVAAARRAFDTVWGPMPGRERAKYLYRIAQARWKRRRHNATLWTHSSQSTVPGGATLYMRARTFH